MIIQVWKLLLIFLVHLAVHTMHLSTGDTLVKSGRDSFDIFINNKPFHCILLIFGSSSK